ncbi:uncharacterized protein LOC123891571 isoform X2 [Trifolium pratense]|uniref:uncharacterized protein LOC123891571 isoform X2 n=1 Tax=Trifolium pratense TaxID=57577 RepID=UPI001E693C83|nr:uncharacterized protein LOC123891571 isoform X2 [Trifolium pratense]XP_045797412.1 uncharacterized protein LOC123891571 isoform X2 [Trifolium pratense]XP_045797413.1 uncharacterized protein LOC123891571 isoform X2 [Trifolium pratense]
MQVDKMASKKLGMEHGNNEDDSNQSNSSDALPLPSSGKKMKEDMDISPLDLDMLDIISKKLLSFDDLFNFSAVCKEWRAVHKVYWRKFLESQSPLVVQTTSYAKKLYSFYSIPEKQAYNSKMSYFWGLYYCGSSSGYLVMAGGNYKLQLMNPFTRKEKIVDISSVREDFFYDTCRVLLAFAKDSNEFVVVALCGISFALNVYQSRFSSWVPYAKRGKPWKVVDFVVLDNIIYALTDKVEIGVLSLNSTSLKLLELKNTPDATPRLFKLLHCDGKLLVVRFVPKRVLDVYRIDFATMSYVKLESLGELALFYSPYKCYALANPGEWGYESNRLYYINSKSAECEVYSGSDNVLMESIVLAGSRHVLHKSKPYWLDWCFRNLHDEVDYSLVE